MLEKAKEFVRRSTLPRGAEQDIPVADAIAEIVEAIEALSRETSCADCLRECSSDTRINRLPYCPHFIGKDKPVPQDERSCITCSGPDGCGGGFEDLSACDNWQPKAQEQGGDDKYLPSCNGDFFFYMQKTFSGVTENAYLANTPISLVDSIVKTIDELRDRLAKAEEHNIKQTAELMNRAEQIQSLEKQLEEIRADRDRPMGEREWCMGCSLEKENAELKAWKEDALRVDDMLCLQEIGEELGLKLGQTIADKVLPAIRKMKADNAEMGNKLATILRP